MGTLNEIQIVNDINNIILFLSKRDIDELTPKALHGKFGITKVDMLIILGNSIPYIAELGADAYKNCIAEDLMVVGGIGHSTKYLIENVQKNNKYIDINTNNKSEADILSQIIEKRINIDNHKIIIENKSTNCGSNAHESLNVLKKRGHIPKSILLIQDPTMQIRTHASFLKEWSEEKTLIISYSPFIPKVKVSHNGYTHINNKIDGLWSKERFIDLIMGEIPRLRDDSQGYGPMGKGFIGHVDIPEKVLDSYNRLLTYYAEYNEIRLRK
ncbi:ElyC/SanA/YdcF family protein [Clostridium sp. JN-9]|uniref:ElyC/SanA/YdcF family protein n=1 Tax=Clostridium sp. JN-9 TaxID=2507159 RepID=UPI001FA97EDF|nr:ElyC/SanA/YdcF family protein [Clostridium sp. JN-9]